jgi:hypothetical protein
MTHSAAGALWRAAEPHEAVDWLACLTVPWWIAGGWALDLYLGESIRAHRDLDIGIARGDVSSACRELSGWEFYEARGGALTPLVPGDVPRADVNSLWCKRLGRAEWELELMLDEFDEGHWVFRRNPAIQRPTSMAIRQSVRGIAYLAPEIQLLYKARPIRTQDQIDFDLVVVALDPEPRDWLRAALTRMDPAHAWLSAL